jgi:hypothetical protein
VPDSGKAMSPPPNVTTMTVVRHTDKSLYGDIDQQLRYILMPKEAHAVLFLHSFFSSFRDRDKEIKIIDRLGKRTAPLQHRDIQINRNMKVILCRFNLRE